MLLGKKQTKQTRAIQNSQGLPTFSYTKEECYQMAKKIFLFMLENISKIQSFSVLKQDCNSTENKIITQLYLSHTLALTVNRTSLSRESVS